MVHARTAWSSPHGRTLVPGLRVSSHGNGERVVLRKDSAP